MKKIIKYLKRFFIFILLLLIIISVGLIVTGNEYVFKAVPLVYFRGRTTAGIDDYKDFSYQTVKTGTPQVWEKDKNYNQIPLTDSLQRELRRTKTAEFVIIHQGKLLSETYYEPFVSSSPTNSFSMAKTITTLLVQKAIEDGYIKSFDQKITDFLPEYNNDPFGKLCTIRDLSQMTSGYDWVEDYYFPINPTAQAYYDDKLEEVILTRPFIAKPGIEWKYLSGNTQLLGFLLKRAIKIPLGDYLSEKLWQPLGMERPALWTMDRENGNEKTYCCIYANAKDFAKLGQLMLNKGQWNGKTIIDSTFVKQASVPNQFSNGKYGNSFWMDYRFKVPFYLFRGHLGQYIICIPSKDVVIVRLGELKDNSSPKFKDQLLTNDVYVYIEEALKMIQQKK